MSLYREPGRARRRRRLIAAGVLAALVAVAVLVVLLAGGDEPTAADRARTAQRAADDALNGLELVEIEYAQAVKDGAVVAETEYTAARADVERARRAIADHAADIRTVDPAAPAAIDRALAAVAEVVAQRGEPAALSAAADAARARLSALREAAAAPAP